MQGSAHQPATPGLTPTQHGPKQRPGRAMRQGGTGRTALQNGSTHATSRFCV